MTLSATRSDVRPVPDTNRLKPVRIWLYALAALVLLMVVVGGATRLTESGLSITSWKPISGIVLPLSDADWQAEFEAYKQIPQYAAVNSWMGLEDFKYIFWWEWTHRFLGRVLGFAFAIPFVVFLVQRRFSWNLAAPLGVLFVLGGFQGFLGWWMVSSGLTELTSVSQYRLAAHLLAASLLFIALIWVARRLIPHRRLYPVPIAEPPVATERWPAATLLILILLQIVAGAFVAGLDAGLGWNTWPLMNGALIPTGLTALEPFWRNLFENALTVQFIHRCLAYVIVGYAAWLLWRRSRAGGFVSVHAWLPRLFLLILLQVGLGIATLLGSVPLSLALGHQALAFMLAGAVTAYLADLTPPGSRIRQTPLAVATIASHLPLATRGRLMPGTGKGEGRINRQFDRIQRRFPATKGFLDWLRSPRSRIFRIPIAVLLILGGIFSILPVLGIWMLPLGLLLLALDLAFLRTPIAAAILRTLRKWQTWRRERKRQKTWTS